MPREREVACENQTYQQFLRGAHTTWNDRPRVCDRCQLSASTWIDADRDALAVDGERVPTFGASRYATGLDAPAFDPLSTPQVER